ncbi:MAG: hypothetical protein ACE5HE_13130 [Phycisphaerae bacterium]
MRASRDGVREFSALISAFALVLFINGIVPGAVDVRTEVGACVVSEAYLPVEAALYKCCEVAKVCVIAAIGIEEQHPAARPGPGVSPAGPGRLSIYSTEERLLRPSV